VNRVRFSVQSIVVITLLMIAFSVSARGIYQTDEAFLAETFNNQVPKSQVVWIKGDLRKSISDILGHNYAGLRIRYWQQEGRKAWILEEIGKVEPITFGVITTQNKVEKVTVLAFRESRGGEIRYPAFTQQFNDAKLKGTDLDRHIDGISGATLSVRAMTAIVTLALYLDKITSQQS
jgi:FMN-binding protein